MQRTNHLVRDSHPDQEGAKGSLTGKFYMSILFFSAVLKRKVHVKFLLNARASHKALMLKHMKELVLVDPTKISVKIYTVSLINF